MPRKSAIHSAWEAAKAMVNDREILERAGIEIKLVEGGWLVRGVTYPLLKEALAAARRLS